LHFFIYYDSIAAKTLDWRIQNMAPPTHALWAKHNAV